MKKGKIVIISGPSGVGKTTIRKELFKDPSLKLAFSISMTTRKKRENETNHIDYHFVGESEFKKAVSEDKFLEHARFAQNYYGTLEEDVDKLLEKGLNVVLEIELEGAKQIIDKRDDVISFFFMPPDFKELKRRLVNRKTDSKKAIRKRLKRAKQEIKLAHLYNFTIINDELDKAIEEIKDILKEKNK